MSVNLKLHTQPAVPLETENITPDKFRVLDKEGISNLPVMHGKEQSRLSDFFSVEGEWDEDIQIEGDLSLVKHVGARMTTGRITIHGNIGAHLGVGMQGGEITVHGNAGDWVGPEITGGRITINGNAGHLIGSVYRGGTTGMQGGEIIIKGNAKNEIGHGMRNGLIIIGGNTGDFTGVNMLAGTIIALGQMGIRTGAGMKRGSIISMYDAPVIPTFSYSCCYRPTFIRIIMQYLKKLGFDINNDHMNGEFHRWCGDGVELNKGEILLFAG